MMSHPHVELLLQDKYLINGVEGKMRMVSDKNAFALVAGGYNCDYKIKTVNATLFVENATLNLGTHLNPSRRTRPSIPYVTSGASSTDSGAC